MESGFWAGARVLVTGATGFVGAWLVRSLVGSGADVVGLLHDQLPETTLEALGYRRRIVTVSGSVTDLPLLERLLNRYEVDTCFHLAAQATVGAAKRAFVPTLETNVLGTWNVLEACHRTSTIRRVVVASSDKVYGDAATLPISEDVPLGGLNPYDASKVCVDIVARSYAGSFDLPVVVARCSNIYGGGDFNFSRIIPDSMRSALRGERPVIRSDGTPVRDYLYVEDAVAAYRALAEQAGRPGVRGLAFNFGTGRPVSVLELVALILRLADRADVEPEILGRTEGEIQAQYLDSSRARSLLGWQSKVPLEEGLGRALAWYREYFAGRGPEPAGPSP